MACTIVNTIDKSYTLERLLKVTRILVWEKREVENEILIVMAKYKGFFPVSKSTQLKIGCVP